MKKRTKKSKEFSYIIDIKNGDEVPPEFDWVFEALGWRKNARRTKQ